MNLNYQAPNQIIWEENESTGKRHVDIVNGDNGVKLIAIISNKSKNASWESKIIPMGYSFDKDEVLALSYEMGGFVSDLMKYLESTTEITYEDILSFIGLE